MLTKTFVPYKGYWSSPFCRWQGTLQNEHAVHLGAATARRFFKTRNISPTFWTDSFLDHCLPEAVVLRSTTLRLADRERMDQRSNDSAGLCNFYGFRKLRCGLH